MLSRTARRTLLPIAAALLAAAMAAPASAQPAPHPDATAAPNGSAQVGQVASITDALARGLARTFTDTSTEQSVAAAVAAGPVDLLAVEPGSAFARRAKAANKAVLAAKGLPAAAGSMLQVRLADPSMAAALGRGEMPLVAATPTDDTPTAITAYGTSGASVSLDVSSVPRRPVLLVEVDTARAVPWGLEVMRQTLAGRGFTNAVAPATSGGYWATKIDAVRLSDDEEPWFKGAAEIYSIVGGFDLNGVAKVDIVNMPYLDHDGTTYYPNQLLVHYSAYKYNLADVVMMEDDGDTNYQSLAIAITDALLTVTDQGVYIPLVNAILNAIPSSWWTDDPDYVDSWYTLATTTSGRHYGAAANGWMDLEPYWVSEL